MKKRSKKMVFILTLVLVALVFAGVGAYAASSLGSQGDPLVTLSYVNEKLYPELLEKISQESDKVASELKASIGSSGGVESYAVVSLGKGQKLVGSVGCELLLRVGSASVIAADNPGLIDMTDAATLNAGASMVKNHLYMVTIAGGGIQAADSVKVIVRGGYTIQ